MSWLRRHSPLYQLLLNHRLFLDDGFWPWTCPSNGKPWCRKRGHYVMVRRRDVMAKTRRDAVLTYNSILSFFLNPQITSRYMEIPVISRLYLTGAFLTTAACAVDIISPFSLYFNWTLVFTEGQVWRLITSYLFFGVFSVDFLFHMYFLVSHLEGLFSIGGWIADCLIFPELILLTRGGCYRLDTVGF